MTDAMTAASLAVKPTRNYANYARPVWQRVLFTREMGIVALLVLVVIVAMSTVNNFGSPVTVSYLLLDVAPILLIALPMALIMITGEIDLSVASIVGLSSVVVGTLTQGGVPFEIAAVVALLAGMIGGAVNGFLVTVVGLPSLAVTIGSMALFRGIAVGLLGTTAVTDFPEFWTDLARSKIEGTPIPTIMVPFIVLLIVFVILLHFTPFGRGIFSIGLNKEAAIFSGVSVNRTKFILFVLSGLVSAFAGIYFTLRFGTARGDNATGLELQVIAAVVLGGVSVFGGRGALHGVLAGVLLIGTLGSALRLANVSSDLITILTGALLVVSVVAASFLGWARTKRVLPKAREKGGVPGSAG
jgi:rhamnose transport system permease protein